MNRCKKLIQVSNFANSKTSYAIMVKIQKYYHTHTQYLKLRTCIWKQYPDNKNIQLLLIYKIINFVRYNKFSYLIKIYPDHKYMELNIINKWKNNFTVLDTLYVKEWTVYTDAVYSTVISCNISGAC